MFSAHCTVISSPLLIIPAIDNKVENLYSEIHAAVDVKIGVNIASYARITDEYSTYSCAGDYSNSL